MEQIWSMFQFGTFVFCYVALTPERTIVPKTVLCTRSNSFISNSFIFLCKCKSVVWSIKCYLWLIITIIFFFFLFFFTLLGFHQSFVAVTYVVCKETILFLLMWVHWVVRWDAPLFKETTANQQHYYSARNCTHMRIQPKWIDYATTTATHATLHEN